MRKLLIFFVFSFCLFFGINNAVSANQCEGPGTWQEKTLWWAFQKLMNQVERESKRQEKINAAYIDAELPWREKALFRAINQRSPILVRLALAAGADVNVWNIGAGTNIKVWNIKDTPLLRAVKYNDVDVIRILLKAGADAGKHFKYMPTPLGYAIRYGDAETVRVLVAAGADKLPDPTGVGKSESVGELLLVYTVSYGDAEKVRILLEAGADVNKRDRYGRTALMLAVWPSCDDAMVALLLKAGADVNSQDRSGQTALMGMAANNSNGYKRSCYKVVERLLAAGADINIRDKIGFTALMIAKRDYNNEFARLLLEAGAKK